ncbi:MAG: RpiB/LacA/LacB family sugar-phosphate isomerase [Polyangiaceae bacterium]|nr:RpiB/LacA/LacB family sugar-phosphate isomerase [Polyangiaceae bacterium]MCE7889110.1 RpiB/LacA/LacB family sugar-phosphate isomerase [Sorangiineae bacterium PRO1]
MIRQQGSHQGKRIFFGWDRHLLGQVDAYVAALGRFGPVLSIDAIDAAPHYLAASEWVCRNVAGAPRHAGVLICATGIGVSIAANKFRGIYAARCSSAEDAELSRTVNNCNVLCLAARSGLELNQQILSAFFAVPYEGRRLEQLELITTLEMERVSPLRLVGVGEPPSRRRVG